MSADAQDRARAERQDRTDEAMEIAEPLRDSRIAPRVIPIVVAVLIGVAVIALLRLVPRYYVKE